MTITSNVLQQINQATAAHGMWKARLRDAIQKGSSEFSVDKVGKDNLCDFGKWLHGGCDAATKGSPHHAKVCALHAAFHKEAAAILGMALAGKKDEAQKGLDSTFASKSLDLVREMQNWKNS